MLGPNYEIVSAFIQNSDELGAKSRGLERSCIKRMRYLSKRMCVLKQKQQIYLGGGFKYFLIFIPYLVKWSIQFDVHIFQMGGKKTNNYS